MSHGSLRLRLAFDSHLTSYALQKLTHHIMYQPWFLPPDIAGLASMIQHEFGISEPGGLALSIDTWRLPLCSSTTMLRDNDTLQVSPGTGSEPSLQKLEGLLWTKGFPAVLKKPATGRNGPLAIGNGTKSLPAQHSSKKRKGGQLPADKAPTTKASALPKAPAPVPEADTSEESEESRSDPESERGSGCESDYCLCEGEGSDDSEESEESESESEVSEDDREAPAKHPSRNARRKKHKRQLKRLGLLKARPDTTPGSQNEQQDEAQQVPVIPEADRTDNRKRRRTEEAPARPHQAEPEQEREGCHTKLPKRGELWQHSADVAEFVQKGHVHFMDSDAEEDVSTGQGGRQVHDKAAPQLSGLPNGSVSKRGVQQRPEQAPVTQHAQQAHQMKHPVPVDYESLPKPSPYPLEGDIVAYRLLHIGADWTPQVSEWREGRILSLDTAEQSVAVEPWAQNRTMQRSGQVQDRDAFEDDGEEEEQPPTEYDEDGVLTTSLHSFADLRIIINMASSMPGSGAKERWRHQSEHVADAEQPGQVGVDVASELGSLPPPPLVNGLLPDRGRSECSELRRPDSRPVSGRLEGQEQQAPARAQRSQHHADISQPAQVAAHSSELPSAQQPPAQQVPAERSASHLASQSTQRPVTLPEAIRMTNSRKTIPAHSSTPTGHPVAPVHSPLGPPVPGRAAGRSPAGFAQVAAALKARRAELAARQKAPPAGHQSPAAATIGVAQFAAAMKQPRADLAEQRASPTAEQQEPLIAEALTGDSHGVIPTAAPASHGQPADRAVQQQDSGAGLPRQLYGVKTRSAAREEEHTAVSAAPESSPGTQPPQASGSVTEPSPQEGTPGSNGQMHAKRPRASTRGSLIGPLLARLRREEEEATGNGTAAD